MKYAAAKIWYKCSGIESEFDRSIVLHRNSGTSAYFIERSGDFGMIVEAYTLIRRI